MRPNQRDYGNSVNQEDFLVGNREPLKAFEQENNAVKVVIKED